MIEKNLRSVRKEGLDSVSGVVVKPGISEYQIFATSGGAFISTSTTYSNEVEYVVNQNKVFRLWILASGANYAGGQTITFTFKMKSEDSNAMISTTAKTVTVTTPAVLAGAAGFVDLVDADDCFEQYDYFTVSGTITVATNGKVKGILLAQSDVSMATTHVEIVNANPIETTQKDNEETSVTGVETYIELPVNMTSATLVLDATDSCVATVYMTPDRAGIATTPEVEVEWYEGAITNDKAIMEIGRMAGVRMEINTDNHVAEVKSSYTTSLAGANNDMVYTSKLTGTAGDAITIEYVDNGLSVNEVKSSMTTDLVGDNNDIVYTSKLTGVLGDNITVAYLDPEMESQTLEVVVQGTAIEVYLATNDQNGGEIISTADEIKAAIAVKAEAHALVGTADKAGNDGSGVVTAMAATPLANGVDPVVKALSVVVTGTDIVVNLAADDSAITTTAADIKTAIEGTPAAHALVGLANAGADTGAGIVTALAHTHLANGVNYVAPTLPKLWVIVG